MNNRQTINKEQYFAADEVLRRLHRTLAPRFIGLVSATGHSIDFIGSSEELDADAISSLAASSYAATRQLARMMTGAEFTLMFHEGTDLNVHIAQVSDDVLLVICFSDRTEIGKVRLIGKKAVRELSRIMKVEE